MEQDGTDREANEQFDTVIELRRTVRSFTDELPPRESIEQIIKAGLLAPYAAPAVAGEKVFRRFFVFERAGQSMTTAVDIAIKQMRENVQKMKSRCESDPSFARKAGAFVKRLEMIAETGQVPLAQAPYYIVVAEKKGIPAVEMQSLAHCLENMWLKATALGLGFRLISMTTQMGEDPDFCKLIGLPPGEFGLDGCTVGYATEWPPATDRPSFEEAVSWLP